MDKILTSLLLMLMVAVGALLFAFPFLWIWNGVVIEAIRFQNNSGNVWKMPEISYWQSYCLLLFSWLFLKSSNAGD